MKCKACKNEIPEGSLYCMYCGNQIVRQRKQKGDIKVPKPRKIGNIWNVQIMVDGKRVSVSQPTEELCITAAKAIRAGMLEKKKTAPRVTLDTAMSKYIENRSAIISPSTYNGYECIRRTRFLNYNSKDAKTVNWQAAVNEEASLCSAKTLRNAWAFARSALREAGVEVNVSLPQLQPQERPWLDTDQIQIFIREIHGRSYELPALLALGCGLRKSELFGLQWRNVSADGTTVSVHGAKVRGADGKTTYKETNKNASSVRTVPVFIPRLTELLNEQRGDDDAFVCTHNITSPEKSIKALCIRLGLPPCTMHSLRHSFVSACYAAGIGIHETMRLGGYSDYGTVNRVYTHLSQRQLTTAAQTLKDVFVKPVVK